MAEEQKPDQQPASADKHGADGHEHGKDAHGHDDHSHGHDDHSHGHDDHAHGHDDHAVPADAIKEGSVYDTALSGLALLVGLALVGLIVYWCGLKPAVVAEGEPGTQHEVQHEAPANTEPAPIH